MDVQYGGSGAAGDLVKEEEGAKYKNEKKKQSTENTTSSRVSELQEGERQQPPP